MNWCYLIILPVFPLLHRNDIRGLRGQIKMIFQQLFPTMSPREGSYQTLMVIKMDLPAQTHCEQQRGTMATAVTTLSLSDAVDGNSNSQQCLDIEAFCRSEARQSEPCALCTCKLTGDLYLFWKSTTALRCTQACVDCVVFFTSSQLFFARAINWEHFC